MPVGGLYHGGVAGRRPGDVILPNMAEHRFVDSCPHCAAQKAGEACLDPATPPDWVYASSDIEYARYYASRATRGSLYRVSLDGDVERSTEDPFPTWRGRRATVVEVVARSVTLTMKQRRRLYIRWGGDKAEFREMVADALGARP